MDYVYLMKFPAEAGRTPEDLNNWILDKVIQIQVVALSSS